MLLALMWHYAGNGRGEKDMVILPYKDRLMLFSKYLQQLVMESLGKEIDLDGKVVHQGIAVYGNKGSTDQHAYVQQLRDGVPNFFVTFIEVRQGSGRRSRFEVEEGVTSGDYLQGFLRGTRSALYESGRESITLTIPEVNAFTVGALIALYERAVGFYASLVNINAYHQPGVEAGKKAATRILELQQRVQEILSARENRGRNRREPRARAGRCLSYPAAPGGERRDSGADRRSARLTCGERFRLGRAEVDARALALSAGCARVSFRHVRILPHPNSDPRADIQVSMPDVVKFVRQLAHDLRNHLNAAELQSAYLDEIAEDAS